MIALVHAASLFDIDPRTVTYIPDYSVLSDGGASIKMPTQEEATILKESAYNAVYNFDINNFLINIFEGIGNERIRSIKETF